MTNEKPNDNSGWINKLDQLEHIQDEPFNKEASWNKLHERLHAKSNNKKAIWYWLAAACLFFAFFISLLMSHKKESVLVKNILPSKKNDFVLVQQQPMIKVEKSLIVSSLPTKNKLPVKSNHPINITAASNGVSIPINENKKEEITTDLSNSKSAVISVDTVIALVANMPEKKKLKVVHINELGDPVSETPNIARSEEQHSFQFKFMNPQVYTKPSSTVTKTGFKIFTIKNLTNN